MRLVELKAQIKWIVMSFVREFFVSFCLPILNAYIHLLKMHSSFEALSSMFAMNVLRSAIL